MKMNAHSFDTDPVLAIQTPRHQRALKEALMQAHPASQGKFIPFPSKFMSFFKYALPLGATMALALFLAQGHSAELPEIISTPTVSAQELVSEVAAQIQALTPDQVKTLEEKLKVTALPDLIADAQKATDLHDLDSEPISNAEGDVFHVSFLNDSMAFVTDDEGYESMGTNARPVVYTDSEGATVLMMVGQDLYPSQVMILRGQVSVDGQSTAISDITFMATSPWDGVEPTGFFPSFSAIIDLDPSLSLDEKKAELIKDFQNFTQENPDLGGASGGFIMSGTVDDESDDDSVQGDSSSSTSVENVSGDCDENSPSYHSWTSEDGMMGGGGC